MCLDAYDKLWVGCIDGQVFIVDTIQHICSTQLASIEGKSGCQTMTFDTIRNQMLIANRSGLIIIWNTNNRQRLIDINLEEVYKQTCNIQQRIYKSEMLLNPHSPTEEPTASKTRIFYLYFTFVCFNLRYFFVNYSRRNYCNIIQ